jgi:ABC transport system ATP-binding/permease protein
LPPIFNAQNISKSYGAAPLFRGIAFTIEEGDRIGVIGPNGSGKSTLLQILSGAIGPDSGELAVRKRVRLSLVQQESNFAAGQTVRSVIEYALGRSTVPADEWPARMAETLGRAGLEDLDAPAESLSGGWRKRLAIAEALVQQPDILLLDEPTNHLDLAAIEWLEELLQSASFASVVVSHDRYFLENVATTMVELNRVYSDGLIRVAGNYSKLLEEKEAFLHAQAKHQDALENRVHREIEWLRRGPKARTSKSKARIDKANQLIGELADLNARTRTASANIDFSATERKTKRLIELQDVSLAIGGRTLFRNLSFVLTAGMRIGLVGPNGSGKTTLLRLLSRELVRGCIADCLLRPEPYARSGCHAASRSCARQRLRRLSGPRRPRGLMGITFFVYRRAAESASRTPFGRGACPRVDCQAHAAACRCAAAR